MEAFVLAASSESILADLIEPLAGEGILTQAIEFLGESLVLLQKFITKFRVCIAHFAPSATLNFLHLACLDLNCS